MSPFFTQETFMQIADQCVASFHYTLTNDAGEVLDSSEGHEPLVYIHGGGGIIPGLEKAMAGKKAGDAFEVTIAPAEAYGERDNKLIERVPKRNLKGIPNPSVGMRLQANGPNGPQVVTITHVAGDVVTVDANHALAGETLHFKVNITDVRAATEEEIAHGHVHGAGGHHH